MVKITPEMWEQKRAKYMISDLMEARMGANDYEATDGQRVPLEEMKRPDVMVLEQIRSTPPPPSPGRLWKMIEEYEEILAAKPNDHRPENIPSSYMNRLPALMRATIRKEEGNSLFKGGNYEAAIAKYLEAMRFILTGPAIGNNLKEAPVILPSPQYLDPRYLEIGEHCSDSHGTGMEFLDLVALAGNISQSYTKLGRLVQAIDWLEEVMQMIICLRMGGLKDKPSWKDYHLMVVDYWVLRVKNQLRGHTLFTSLGNTSVAAWYSQGAWNDVERPEPNKYPKIDALAKELSDPVKFFGHRHPDPNLIDKVQLTCPEIQVRGTWEKLPSPSQGPRPRGRCAHSCWIWKSRLYICLGVGENQFEVKDMWYLDLTTNFWKQLPTPPMNHPVAGLSSIRPMRVWRDKAYLFVGTQSLHVFDLIAEKWSILKTTMPRGKAWPYSNGPLQSFASTILDNKFYVFGGEEHNGNPLGENIFMSLDLLTNKWEHLSGTSENTPQTFEPNLRSLPCMWADPKEHKIYVMYGAANRTLARYKHAAVGGGGGAEHDYTYSDFWSYHIVSKQWQRERRRGNFPAPRTEAASAFSDAVGRAIVYGGYHSNISTLELEQGFKYDFAFFGDTFIFYPETKLWQHVLVRGFPSYRAMPTIACDPDTGKIYLFGGYSNSDFVPAKTLATKAYNDVWTLKLDLPGGHWNPEDLNRDIRAEKMGPWMRCFSCGNCGISWQKCAGSCGGKSYFCSKDCQRNGWKEHKEKHGCRKL